jgi:predicted nuclease with TOPRIM domain
MDAQLSELSGRFNLMDRQIAALTRDVRDLRGGITRHLVEQGKRLTAMEARLDTTEGRLDKMEGRLGTMDGRLGTMEGRLGTMDGRLERLEEHVDRLGVRLETRLEAMGPVLDEILRRLPSRPL